MLFVKRTCSNFQRINTITKTNQPGDTLGVRVSFLKADTMQNIWL